MLNFEIRMLLINSHSWGRVFQYRIYSLKTSGILDWRSFAHSKLLWDSIRSTMVAPRWRNILRNSLYLGRKFVWVVHFPSFHYQTDHY